MSARFPCPECSAVLRIATTATAGQKIRCPSCHAVFPPPAEDAGDRTEYLPQPPRPNGKLGLLIGLGAGVGLVLLACAGGLGAFVWYRAARGPVEDGAPPVAQATNEPDAGHNPPLVPGNPPPGPPHPHPPLPGGPARPIRPGASIMDRFRDDETLTVVITGIRDEQTRKHVLDTLTRQLPPGNSATQSQSAGDVTEVLLAPVGDPETFARKIDFGTVTRVAGRVIYVTMKELDRPPPGPGRAR